MQGCGIKQNETGAILVIVLIFLLVMTVMVCSNSEDLIVNQKMRQAVRHHAAVLLRAEAGMQQKMLAMEGESVDLPDSSIFLRTTLKNIKVDKCGNQTVQIFSTAEAGDDTVMLNSEDIFARVPREKGCHQLPLYQCVWWRQKVS